MFQTKVVEKIKTHILCSVTFFFENRAVYEIMLKNLVEPERPRITKYCGVCGLHAGQVMLVSRCVILTAFLRQQWFRKHTADM